MVSVFFPTLLIIFKTCCHRIVFINIHIIRRHQSPHAVFGITKRESVIFLSSGISVFTNSLTTSLGRSSKNEVRSSGCISLKISALFIGGRFFIILFWVGCSKILKRLVARCMERCRKYLFPSLHFHKLVQQHR